MTYVLGSPFVVGRFTVVVVSRQTVNARKVGRKGVAVACHKVPAYVVVQNRQDRSVLDMSGAKVPMEEVLALCPAVETL